MPNDSRSQYSKNNIFQNVAYLFSSNENKVAMLLI